MFSFWLNYLYGFEVWQLSSLDCGQIIPTQMKRMLEDGSSADNSLFEDVTIDPVVRGFIRDWDAMEDLLHHVLYTGLGWEVGNEGQILFTDPLSTPKVRNLFHSILANLDLQVDLF